MRFRFLRRALAVVATAGPIMFLGGCPKPPICCGSAPLVLAPPPAGQGIQLHVGPFDVPTAGAPYVYDQAYPECQKLEPTFATFQHPLPATSSGEVQRNYYMKFPSDQDEDIVRVQMKMRKGSHHMNLFKTELETHPDCADDTFDQVAFDTYDLFAGSQVTNTDWVLPSGTGIHVKAHEQLDLQTHYVNTVDQQTPDKGEVLVNLWFAPKGEQVQHMGTLFANNHKLDIPPYATQDIKMWFTFDHDVHLASMTGHFHYHGKYFRVYRWDGAQDGDLIYDSENWDEPPFKLFSDPGIPVASGQGIQFDTYYVNNTKWEITFGGHVEPWTDKSGVQHGPQEHSNLFVYFYPADSQRDALYTTVDASESAAHLSQER